MARSAKKFFVELTPKNAEGVRRISHRGQKWILKRTTYTPFVGAKPGEWLALLSVDGGAFLWVQKIDDPDFSVRVLC